MVERAAISTPDVRAVRRHPTQGLADAGKKLLINTPKLPERVLAWEANQCRLPGLSVTAQPG